MQLPQRIQRPNRCDYERACYQGRYLIVRELDQSPRIQQVGTKTPDAKGSSRIDSIAHRMLHEGIRDQDEVAGQPTSERNRYRCQKVIARTQSFFAPDERADEGAFQEECEHPFHRQGLSDRAARVTGKVCPIRSELKFHGNAGYDANGKIEPKNLGPKADGLIVFFISCLKSTPFPIHKEPAQPHGELRKQVVINERKAKLKPAPKRWI